MSLIISNKQLKDVAIVFIKALSGEKDIVRYGDLLIIKINNEVAGLNIKNFNKYFEVKDGAHTINKDQRNAIEKIGYVIEENTFFSIGEVIENVVHPKSDKLFKLKVKTDKELQIVTNAKNALVGSKVVVANIGAILPSGTDIVKSKIMGVESHGMLCGGETLGLEQTEGVYHPEGNAGDKFIL